MAADAKQWSRGHLWQVQACDRVQAASAARATSTRIPTYSEFPTPAARNRSSHSVDALANHAARDASQAA